jgi:cystathionine beta-lyase/cystathionine gamma-synthase
MDRRSLENLCPRPSLVPPPPNLPLSPPIYPASVYQCDTPAEANALLSADDGIVYQRDGHPNAAMLAEKCRTLHQATRAMMTGSGMSGLAAILLATLKVGDHVVASQQLYGRSLQLVAKETARLGIDCSVVDTTDLGAVQAAMRPTTRLIVVETISNPLLRVADIAGLAAIARSGGAELVVDNTFASPAKS